MGTERRGLATRKPVKHRYNDVQAAALQDTQVSVEKISQPDGNVLVDPLLHPVGPALTAIISVATPLGPPAFGNDPSSS